MDRRQQRFERRPVERRLDPVQKPSDLPAAAHQRIYERRLRQVTARHRRIILFGPNLRESNPPNFCKALFLSLGAQL